MLFNELALLYDKNKDIVGKKDNDGTLLLPISHSTNNANVEITIDLNGNFIRANVVDDEDKETLIPVTEDSASRGAGVFPHPLCDKLIYIAGDYNKYIKNNKLNNKHTECFNSYLNLLKKWTDSEFTHYKLSAVYNYVSQKHLIEDLIKADILELNEKNLLDDKIKINKISQTDIFIRFIVEPSKDNLPCQT